MLGDEDETTECLVPRASCLVPRASCLGAESLILILLCAGYTPALANDLECSEHPGPEVAVAEPRWVSQTGGIPDLVANVPGDLTYRVDVRARLGALKTSWTEGPLTVGEGGELVVRLTPPPAAQLHPLAADYLTDLSIRIVAMDTSGADQFIVHAPPAFLAWPSGLAGEPVLWDEAAAAANAPRGVVSVGLRNSLPEGNDRVMPPLLLSEPPPLDDLQKGD